MTPQEIKDYATANNILILSHSYQEGSIQDAAHFVGDSLELARIAAEQNPTKICFCGVHFMAETAAILCPDAKIFVPDLDAGCSLASGCTAKELEARQKELRREYPQLVTICYVNTSAEVKALCDLVCTSGNALDVVDSVPFERPILFVPDKHLGKWVAQQSPKHKFFFWDAACEVHELFKADSILSLKIKHNAEVLVHPETPSAVRAISEHVKGTAGMLKIVKASTNKTFIVATESNMIYRFEKEAPQNRYIPAPSLDSDRNLCQHMQKNTLEKLWACIQAEGPVVTVEPHIAAKAKIAVDRMLAIKGTRTTAI